MFAFGNPVVGGVTLLTPAIQSPNFIHDVSGWQIAQNGNAEFNDIMLRGTFQGIDWVANSYGLFFYSGTPAAGNLLFAIANADGNDAAWTSGAGNTYYQAVASYGTGGAWAGLNFSEGTPGAVFAPSSVTQMTNPPVVYSFADFAGAANEIIALVFQSAFETPGGNSYIQLWSESADATIAAFGSIGITGTQVLAWNAMGITANRPITADTWHNMALLNSWAVLNANYYARYQLMPDNSVWIQGRIANGTATAGTSIWTPPAGYAPTQAYGQKIPLIIENTTGAATAANPRLDVTAAGVVVENIASATVISFSGFYSLS